MLKKQLLISGLSSAALAGGVLAGALLKNEEITLKDQLLKKGYLEIKKGKFGPKARLLSQYYSDLEKMIGGESLENWCKKQEKIAEKDKASAQFKEFCFESIGSAIEAGEEFVMLKNDNLDDEEWPKNLDVFNKAFQSDSDKPSDKWAKANGKEDLQKQCQKNERVTYIKEEEKIFQEVKKYCARKLSFSNQTLG